MPTDSYVRGPQWNQTGSKQISVHERLLARKNELSSFEEEIRKFITEFIRQDQYKVAIINYILTPQYTATLDKCKEDILTLNVSHSLDWRHEGDEIVYNRVIVDDKLYIVECDRTTFILKKRVFYPTSPPHQWRPADVDHDE